MRFNMPFGRVGAGEFGTYFIGYARDPDVIEQMLTNMFVGKPARQPRPHPRLLDRASPAPCSSCPTLDFLDDPPDLAPAAVEAAGRASATNRLRWAVPRHRLPPRACAGEPADPPTRPLPAVHDHAAALRRHERGVVRP